MRTYLRVACFGCGQEFYKLGSEVKRCERHYCRVACYLQHVDYRMLGKASAAAPYRRLPSDEVRAARSRLAGLARARNLSADRLREIALAGVRGRMEKVPPERRRAIARENGAKRRWGPAVLGVRLGRRA